MEDKMNNKKIYSFIKQFVFLSFLFGLTAVVLGNSISVITLEKDTDVSAKAPDDRTVVIIDPGHGGEDGGAVASDGTLEKDLNLIFAVTLKDMCGVLGINTDLTRDTDTLLYDKYSDLDNYKGKKKVYDLKNRLRYTTEIGEDALFVGIHMNKFSDPKYSGTQVYYSPNSAESKVLAESIQNKVIASLQPDNKREIKRAGSSIFLLKQLKIPAVLAECGFLSNEAETARLKSTEYKKEFSLTTAVAIGEFLNSKNN